MRSAQVRRLVFGPATFAGLSGVVLDADVARRWSAASRAATWAEFALAMYEQTWDEFAADTDAEESPADPFDFEEWVAEGWTTGPQEAAYDVAAERVRELVADHPAVLDAVQIGGGSPGGNIDGISGPMGQLDALASLVLPSRDGFSLERDDDAVESGMLRHLYRDEVA